MAKRRRLAYAEEDRKFGDRCSSLDRISMLPDELLVHILSFLTLKEANTTAILSSRWRYLWAYTPKLNFDGSELLSGLMFGNREEETPLRQKYVKWVNQAIALHNDYPIEEFRVSFNLRKSHSKCIYEWLEYALSKKVQTLELNLSFNDQAAYGYNKKFTLRNKLLQTMKEKRYSHQSLSMSMRLVNQVDFKYLKKVSTNYVNVNGETVEFVLRNCPLLEHLSISESNELSSLKINGPFPAFKHLEIIFCSLNSL